MKHDIWKNIIIINIKKYFEKKGFCASKIKKIHKTFLRNI